MEKPSQFSTLLFPVIVGSKMPISSSRNRLTHAGARNDLDPSQGAGAKSVPMCSVESQGAASPTVRASGTPESEPRKQQQEKIKLPLLTRIQNSLFRRSRSHGSSVDKPHDNSLPATSPTLPAPSRGRFRRKHHNRPTASPEFALRKIRFFTSPPAPSPLTICFTYPGVDLTHHDVIRAIQSTHAVDVEDIESIQFVDMNVVLGTAGVNNRWLIKVKDYDTRYLLLCDGIKINGDYVILRKYDDVNTEDYKEYLRRKDTLESEEHRDAVQRLLAV